MSAARAMQSWLSACYFSAVVVVVLALPAASAAGKLPAGIKRCDRAAIRAGTGCLAEAVADALPKLKDGVPRLGLPPLNPMVIERLRISQGRGGPVNMNLDFTNFVTTELTENVRVPRVEMDFDKMAIRAESIVPRGVVTSDYTVSGNVLVLPISGSGRCRFQIDEIHAQWDVKGNKMTKKDGKEYMNVTDVTISMKPKKVQMQFDNLFNGEAQLGEAMNRVLNENWELVFSELGDSLNEAYAEVIKVHAGALFRHVPLEELFPETLEPGQ